MTMYPFFPSHHCIVSSTANGMDSLHHFHHIAQKVYDVSRQIITSASNKVWFPSLA